MTLRQILLTMWGVFCVLVAWWIMLAIHEERDAQIEAALKACLGHPDAGKPLPMKAKP